MDDDRTAEGIEHLQRAATELVAAARSFLDVVEDVVEDRDRFATTAASLVDLVRDGLGTLSEHRPDAPWAASAWSADTSMKGPVTEGPATDEAADDTADPNGAVPDRAVPNGVSDTARRSTQRVRRIAVD